MSKGSDQFNFMKKLLLHSSSEILPLFIRDLLLFWPRVIVAEAG